MTRPERRSRGRSSADPQLTIERFLQSSRQPAILEPGEEALVLGGDNFCLETRSSRLTLQAWDQKRNLVRRIIAVREEARGRVELIVERFARKEGSLFLIDLAHPAGSELERRSPRRIFRERFREMLHRQLPDWKLEELSVETDLEHSLSPACPRAFLKKGQSGWAAIAAGPEGASGVLSFGLIWLDYLRRREPRITVEGLALFVPCGHERVTCLRLGFLNPAAAMFRVYSYSEEGFAAAIDPKDFGNLETRLETFRRPHESDAVEQLAALAEVERIPKTDGSVSLRVRGMEFARATVDGVVFGLGRRVSLRHTNSRECEQLAGDLAERRSPETADREHPLYRGHPEAWLESQVRAHIRQVDASLLPAPVYNQVPAFAGGERDIMDLVAVEHSGRLVVLELKASADLHLPLQALDYWMRVKWHLDREEFSPRGYFPGIALRKEAPRLLLVSPSLEFHSTTEAILGYFSPAVDVERIGVGVEWRRSLEVMFRFRGSDRP
jgi:hypothetical protein